MSRVLRVAFIDEPPYFYRDRGGMATGSDIDLLAEVARRLSWPELHFVETSFDELIPGLRDERWDINVPMFITPERSGLVLFTRPVRRAPDSLIIRTQDSSRIDGYASIAQQEALTIAVVTGQVQAQSAVRAGVPAERIVEFGDQRACVDAVLSGSVDAAASTAAGNAALLEQLGDSRLARTAAIDPDQAPSGSYSVRRGDRALRAAMDGVLDELVGSARHLELMARHCVDPALLTPARP